MLNLKIIIGSTRPTRKGPAIAAWIFDVAKTHAEFNVELIDLAAINLPMMDEPEHPSKHQYQHQHTKDWSNKIEPADAFIFVTPEYNYGYPAPLKNALDYLYKEWNYKPAAFVSYGGVAAGTRSAGQLKQVFNAVKMVPLTESVHISSFIKYIDGNGKFNADEHMIKSAHTMLAELNRWGEALRIMRNK